MLRPIDDWFLQKEEPVKSCVQFLRSHILALDSSVTERWSYACPFYYYKGKRFCYISVNKKMNQPYLGIVDGYRIDHPDLLAEKRVRMKIFLVDPAKDIPLKKINSILKEVIKLYK
jgi:hypothetical protein